MPRHLSFLLKIKIKQPFSTPPSLPTSFSPYHLFLTLSLPPDRSERERERERERKSVRKRDRELHARTSRKGSHALSIPHSFIQSVSMRDYYINYIILMSRLPKFQTLTSWYPWLLKMSCALTARPPLRQWTTCDHFSRNILFLRHIGINVCPGNPYWRGILNTVELLVLTNADQYVFIFRMFLNSFMKQFLNEEINCTCPSP